MPGGLSAAEIVHAIEGRTRLRIVSRAGDAAYFADLADGLAAMDGVRTVRSRALTGTLVVTHDGPFASLAAQARDAGLFVVGRPAVSDATAKERAMALPATGALALGALAVYQLFQARVLPPALTLLWYALSLAREAQAQGPAAGVDDDGD